MRNFQVEGFMWQEGRDLGAIFICLLLGQGSIGSMRYIHYLLALELVTEMNECNSPMPLQHCQKLMSILRNLACCSTDIMRHWQFFFGTNRRPLLYSNATDIMRYLQVFETKDYLRQEKNEKGRRL